MPDSETCGSFAPEIPRSFQYLPCQSFPGRCQFNCEEGVCPNPTVSVNKSVVKFTGTELTHRDFSLCVPCRNSVYVPVYHCRVDSALSSLRLASSICHGRSDWRTGTHAVEADDGQGVNGEEGDSDEGTMEFSPPGGTELGVASSSRDNMN